MKKVSLVLLGLVLASAAALAANSTIEDRIKPAGKTCMAGDDCAAKVASVDDKAAGARAPEEIFKKCSACHATGAAGAPKFGDKAAWAPRIAKGLDVLHSHALSGFNAMPAKGLCFDCSDEEIKNTVDYMVGHSK